MASPQGNGKGDQKVPAGDISEPQTRSFQVGVFFAKNTPTEELRRESGFSPIKSTPSMSTNETNSLTAGETVCLKKHLANETVSY
jgi:hypothetical protein